MSTQNTYDIENKYMAPFLEKQRISIDRGKGVYAWDEDGNKYLDFTSGWGVTCIGHANPVITKALFEQGKRIIQNPNSGLTYSPVRAKLLSLMRDVLPKNLTHVFFSNSGAEGNDAAIKLARKVTGRTDIVSTLQSFHGRTISTASATGQDKYKERFKPLMPNYRFISYDNIKEMDQTLDDRVAAVILEPIQGEGGVRVPSKDYLFRVERMCEKNGSLLIVDEIQTGFCRTGPMFVTDSLGVKADFLTMAKGIAGGFPFGAFAMSERVASRLELSDHGGTYCGNPLGCAVAYAVIRYLIERSISENVEKVGLFALTRLKELKRKYSGTVVDVRGKGLLLLIDFKNEKTAECVSNVCLSNGLFVRQTQHTGVRIFPALNISKAEMEEGLDIIEKSVRESV